MISPPYLPEPGCCAKIPHMTKVTLSVDKRTVTGRKVALLRREGILPANIFGKKTESVAVQLPMDKFKEIFKQAGETSIVYLTVGDEKKSRPVLIANIHRHPVTSEPLHVDFHQVDLTEKTTATVPVVLVGESPAEKDKGAVIVQIMSELEVEALPADLPDKLEVDIATLTETGQSKAVKDIVIDKEKVTIKAEPDEVIVTAQEPQKEEAPAAAPAPEAEPTAPTAPTEGEKKEE